MSRDWFLGYVQAAGREQSDKNLPNRRVRNNSGCLFGLRIGYVYCTNGSLMTLIQPRRLWKPNPEPGFQIWDQLRDARVNLSCPHLEPPCRCCVPYPLRREAILDRKATLVRLA